MVWKTVLQITMHCNKWFAKFLKVLFLILLMFVFKLKAMSYKDVKEAFHVTMGLDPVTEKISSDVELLDSYFSCKILLLFLHFQNLP